MKKIKIIALMAIMFSQMAGAATINKNPTVTNFNTVYEYWENSISNPNSPIYQVVHGANYDSVMKMNNFDQKMTNLFIISEISEDLEERNKSKEGLSSICYSESVSNGVDLASCIKGELIEGGGVNIVNEYFQYKVSKKSWEGLAKTCMENSGGTVSYSYNPSFNSANLGYDKFSRDSSYLANDLCAQVLSEKAYSSDAVFPVTETRTNEKIGNPLGYKIVETTFKQNTAVNKKDLYNRTYKVAEINCADVSWLMASSDPLNYKSLCSNWKINGLNNYKTFESVARLPWESVRSKGQTGGYKTWSSKRCARKSDAFNGRGKSKIRSDWWHHTDTGSSFYNRSFVDNRRLFNNSPYTYRGTDFVMYCQQGKFGFHNKQVRWDFDISYKWTVPLKLGKKGVKTGLGIDPINNQYTFSYPITDYSEYTAKTSFKKFSNNLYSFNSKTMDWLTNEVNWNFANSYSCTNLNDSFDLYPSNSYSFAYKKSSFYSKQGEIPLKVTVDPYNYYLKFSANKFKMNINSCVAN